MVKVIKNTNDKTSSIIKKEVDKFLAKFNAGLARPEHWVGKTPAGFADHWVELYGEDFVKEAIAHAVEKIKKAGYYVWTITGCFGRNCRHDTVYRITESRIRPTPGCKLM